MYSSLSLQKFLSTPHVAHLLMMNIPKLTYVHCQQGVQGKLTYESKR